MNDAWVKRLRGRSNALILLLFLACVLSLWSISLMLDVLGWIEAPPATAEYEAFERTASKVSGFSLALFVATAATFMAWMRAAHTLAEPRVPGGLSLSRAAMVWVWFVPFLNLVRPYNAMVDLWRGAQGSARKPTLVSLWWLAWILSIALHLASQQLLKADAVDQVQIAVYLAIVSDGLSILAAWLLVAVTDKATAGLSLPGSPAVAQVFD